jgi:asparagine synthase (glutamine-hydrolysing)
VSAIAVVLDLRGDRVDEVAFNRVLGAMDDRGPDGTGRWVYGPIGLGHQSLALTVEEVGATQPVFLGELAGVFDGRLDNRDELIDVLLEEPLLGAAAISDAELAVRAYHAWEAGSAARLLGEFVMAIWDGTRQRLYCARDQFGVRPLYYWQNGRILVLATDLRGVLAFPDVSKDPDERTVVDTLQAGSSDRTSTLYRDVKRVPPAHVTVAENGRVVVERYWDVDLNASLRYTDSREYVDHFMAVLGDAVYSRLRCRADATISLSGGQDSSLVTAIAVDQVRRGLVTTSVSATSLVYPGLPCDESSWIEAVTDALCVPARQIKWEPLTWEELLAEATRLSFLPPFPNAMVDMYARDGMRRTVVLSGIGGDQWMGAFYIHFLDVLAGRRYREVWEHVKQGGGPPLARAIGRSLVARTLEHWREIFGIEDPESAIPDWVGPALRENAVPPAAAPPAASAGTTRAKSRRYGTLLGSQEPYAFEVLDIFMMAGELGCTHPFWDRRVIDFIFALPDAERWHGTDDRWLQRRALRRVFPEAIANRRSKAELTPVVGTQVQALPLTDLAGRLRVVDLGWITSDFVPRAAVAGSDLLDGPLPRELWSVMALEAWARTL